MAHGLPHANRRSTCSRPPPVRAVRVTRQAHWEEVDHLRWHQELAVAEVLLHPLEPDDDRLGYVHDDQVGAGRPSLASSGQSANQTPECSVGVPGAVAGAADVVAR